MSNALVVVGSVFSFVYTVIGIVIAAEYPNHGEMPKTRFGRFLLRIVLIATWLPILGLHLFNKALGWLFS